MLKDIVSLCKRRGFIFQSNEIYGGQRGCYDYGPLGLELKKNIQNSWWKDTVKRRHLNSKVYGIETSLLNEGSVFKASGHLKLFFDTVSRCVLSDCSFRIDKVGPLDILNGEILINASSPGELESYKAAIKKLCVDLLVSEQKSGLLLQVDDLVGNELSLKRQDGSSFTIPYYGFGSPCNSPFISTPKRANLMFRTFKGAVDPLSMNEDQIEKDSLFLRPETTQGIMTNFMNVVNAENIADFPFGIAQIGKSFRNELQSEQFIFRTLEFEQMELEFFVKPENGKIAMEYWRERRMKWWNELLNTKDNVREREHEDKELAHYADQCFDLEYKFPWGFSEVEGIANRSDFDLKCHSRESGQELTLKNQIEYPTCIESSTGVNRAMLAILCDALVMPHEDAKKRKYLKLHPSLAPVKLAVLPVIDLPHLKQKAQGIYDAIMEMTDWNWNVDLSMENSIGKRYMKNDEIGTPFCITIDEKTCLDDSVTIRFRDDCRQERVSIQEVIDIVRNAIK